MNKLLILFLLMLLFGCSEQETSEHDMLNNQTSVLKVLCENESACVSKIDTLAESCQKNHINSRDFQALTEMDQIKAIGEFGACIIRQMDRRFQDRFDKAIPMTETGVEISRPSHKANTKGLLVRLMPGMVRVSEKSKPNKDMSLKNLKQFIENQQLADNYSSVLLFVDDDADTGDMVEVTGIFKNAGIEDIQIARK